MEKRNLPVPTPKQLVCAALMMLTTIISFVVGSLILLFKVAVMFVAMSGFAMPVFAEPVDIGQPVKVEITTTVVNTTKKPEDEGCVYDDKAFDVVC